MPLESAPPVTPNPHDAYARFVFQDAARAAEAVSAALGPETAALIDWSTLELEPTALVDEALGNFLPDLRFKARLAGLEIRIDLLFEHQSDSDRLMPVRFFCEVGPIWAEARRQSKTAVPFVLNVVVHNGLEPWVGPRELWQTIEGGEYLRAKAPHLLPALPYVVEDLAVLTDEEIDRQVQSPTVRLTLRALKNARRGGGVKTLRVSPDEASKIPRDVYRETVRYVLSVDRTVKPQEVKEAVQASGVAPAQAQEMVMTWGEQMEQKGWIQGQKAGRAEGEKVGGAKLLLGLIRRRGFTLTSEQQARIESCQDPDQLERWGDALMRAASADEIFAPQSQH
jgi:hypothetical protein